MRHQPGFTRSNHDSFRDAFARQLPVVATSLVLLLIYVALVRVF